MGWCQERGNPGKGQTQPWIPRFVALKGPDIYLFEIPPVSLAPCITKNLRQCRHFFL